MKDTDLYSKILGIEDPWHVDHVEISVETQTIRVFLKHNDKVDWRCPLCNEVYPIYDHREPREWRHLDSCQFKTFIVASLPRIQCPKHGIHTVEVPWSNPNSRFTLFFETFAIDVLSLTKIQAAAAHLLRLSPNQVHDIMCHAVARGLSKRDSTENIPYISLDEKSFKHKHQYVTLLGDPERDRILDVAETRTQKATENLLKNSLSSKQMEGIQAVTMDMWKAFIHAKEQILPKADTVHDRFHIAKYLSDAVDKTRREENRQFLKDKNDILKHTKYLWLTSPENLTKERRKELESQIHLETETSKVWSFKENFRLFLSIAR